MSKAAVLDASRPDFDQVIQDIVDYVMTYDVSQSEEAMKTARHCWMDTIGCGLFALNYPACTKLLGPVLRDRGMLYVALMTGRLEPAIDANPILDKVTLLEVNPDMRMTETRGIFELDSLSFFIENLDMVVTFRNAHNLTAEGRSNLNEAVFESLKPGGVYAVIDHTRRHMEPLSKANYRRSDPVAIVKECLDAGFEFERYSALHRRPQDALTLEVGDEAVTGQTDRFTFLFRKPL